MMLVPAIETAKLVPDKVAGVLRQGVNWPDTRSSSATTTASDVKVLPFAMSMRARRCHRCRLLAPSRWRVRRSPLQGTRLHAWRRGLQQIVFDVDEHGDIRNPDRLPAVPRSPNDKRVLDRPAPMSKRVGISLGLEMVALSVRTSNPMPRISPTPLIELRH